MPTYSKELKKKVGGSIERILWNFIEPEWFAEFEDPIQAEACFRAALVALSNGDFKTPNAK